MRKNAKHVNLKVDVPVPDTLCTQQVHYSRSFRDWINFCRDISSNFSRPSSSHFCFVFDTIYKPSFLSGVIWCFSFATLEPLFLCSSMHPLPNLIFNFCVMKFHFAPNLSFFSFRRCVFNLSLRCPYSTFV